MKNFTPVDCKKFLYKKNLIFSHLIRFCNFALRNIFVGLILCVLTYYGFLS